MRLSKRLTAIAELIPAEARVADIGADHAQLLLSLAQQRCLRKGIAGELSSGPYNAAKKSVLQYGYEQLIEVRQGDGLQVLAAGEVDVVVVAGMGGALICHILEMGHHLAVRYLVLQPNNASYRLRAWLDRHKYRLVAERLVEEAGIIYEVMAAELGEDPDLYVSDIDKELLLEVGPLLWRTKPQLLRLKLQLDLQHRRTILAQLVEQQADKSRQKIFTAMITRLEQLLASWD